jgi:hypothetical protein
MLVMIAPQNAPQKPYTVNPGTNQEANQKARPFMIKINNPKVKKVMGNVRTISTGLIKVLTTPRTSAASIAEKNPLTAKPDTRASAIIRARLFRINLTTQFTGAHHLGSIKLLLSLFTSGKGPCSCS